MYGNIDVKGFDAAVGSGEPCVHVLFMDASTSHDLMMYIHYIHVYTDAFYFNRDIKALYSRRRLSTTYTVVGVIYD